MARLSVLLSEAKELGGVKAKKHPFQVRKMKSGYNGVTKFIVVMNPGNKRVSVHAHLTDGSAQAEADQLNISALVKDHAEDPRPYNVRLADAEILYRNGDK